MGPDPELVGLKVEFDWEAYYYSFVEKHGEPVEFRGKLLFRDGWTYAPDYKGPEWAPPNDLKELRKVQTYYWETRIAILEELLKQVQRVSENLIQTQGNRSCQLLLKTNTNQSVQVIGGMYDDRIEYLCGEIEFAEVQIANIKSGTLAIRTG